MESPSQSISDARIRTGLMLGLEIASRTLWDTAVRIKDDKDQGYSERIAIIKTTTTTPSQSYQHCKG